MIWAGINRQLTPMYEGPGVSEYQQNTRLTVAGELQRRPGMAPANFSPAGGAALGMVGAFPTSGPYGVVIDSTGTVNGFPVTGPRWGWPQVQPPVPQGSQWSMGGNWSGDFTYSTVGTCPGTVRTISQDAGALVTLWRQDTSGVANVVQIIDVTTTTAGQDWTVVVPWSIALPYIRQSHVGGSLGITNGTSTPGCG
jgi:hypothetical protein